MKRSKPAPSLLERLGRNVRRRRELSGRTLRDVAATAGLSPRFLSMVEAGRGNISLTRLERLAQALDAGVVDVIGEAETPPRARPVALLGLRGAGKSTLGGRAAALAGRRFVELDRIVEDAAGMPLAEIFAIHGDPYYRKLEREALERLLKSDEPLVIATGGGIVAAPDTFELLRRGCVTVWLRASPREHWERVTGQGDQRPMESRPDARAELEAILSERGPLYRKADFVIDTSRLGVDAGARALARILESERADPGARPRVKRPGRRR